MYYITNIDFTYINFACILNMSYGFTKIE